MAGSPTEPALAGVTRALAFAALKHRDQRRKGAHSPPFINHAIEVLELLVVTGGVSDPVTLQAAVLHDTLEDTDTRPEEIAEAFGPEVLAVVQEVTDDKRLPAEERRRRQVERSPELSERAKLVRLADKIVNVQAVALAPPASWSRHRRRDYLDWTAEVVRGCRGCSEALERLYDAALTSGVRVVEGEGA